MFLAVYDYAKGIFHPYYAVVMAPAVAALAGAGAVALWRLGRRVAPLGLGPPRHHRRHRALGRCPARPHQRLRHLARAHRRGDGRDLRPRPVALHGATEGHALVRARRGHGGRRLGAGRAGGLLPDDSRHDDDRASRPPVPVRNERHGRPVQDPEAGRLLVGQERVGRRRRRGRAHTPAKGPRQVSQAESAVTGAEVAGAEVEAGAHRRSTSRW